jgi:hypothetical protein
MMTIDDVLQEVGKAYEKIERVNSNLTGFLHEQWQLELDQIERILEEIPETVDDIEIDFSDKKND